MQFRYPVRGVCGEILRGGLPLGLSVALVAAALLMVGSPRPFSATGILGALDPWTRWAVSIVVAALMGAPLAGEALARCNLRLRLSEEGLHYRSVLGFAANVRWEEMVALNHLDAGPRGRAWRVTYRCQPEQRLRHVWVPVSWLVPADDEPTVYNVVRGRARLAGGSASSNTAGQAF